jgi:hypothetical protein
LAELKVQLESSQRQLQEREAAREQQQRKQSELEAERDKLRAELQQHLAQAAREAQAGRDDVARRSGEAQSQAAEIARLSAELEHVRRQSQEELQQLRAQQGQSRDGQVQALEQQLGELRTKLAADEAKWKQQRQDLEHQLASAKLSGGSDSAELTKLREENKQLEQWLAEAEEKAKHAGGEGGQDMEDLRRRFEMAVQDVRELKSKNAELTEQLAKAGRGGGAAGGAPADAGGNWESLKQKLLADLESDFDGADEQAKADKLTVEGAIKITDQVVAEKENEIKELRKLLESQAQQVGEVAVGAAAVAQMLDSDELIRQEREALKRLQDSLTEQLRQAEVDISLERAKLARERAEMEEKLRGLEAEKASLPTGGDGAGDKGKKQGGRKWLARLGLGENQGQ